VLKKLTDVSSVEDRPGNNSSLSWIPGQGGNIFFENTVINATKRWNITNFVMPFQAVMKFLSRLV
jgi:hypothetical protein